MAFQVWGLVSLLIFYLVIFLAGMIAARRARSRKQDQSSEDMMLAGRDLGFLVGIFSMTATWVDGGFINGTAEKAFTRGIIWCQGPIGFAIQLFIGGYFYATTMREAGHVTVLDPFCAKYGKWVGAMFYVPSMLGDVLYNGAILSALGETVAVIINLDVKTSIIISGAIATIYTLAGGMYSVTYTDVVESFFIFIGVLICVPFCLRNPAVGSMSESQTHFWGTIPSKEIGIYVDSFLLIILGSVTWQGYFQRVLSCRTAQTARRVSYTAGILCVLLAIPPMTIGIIAKATDWSKTELGYSPTTDEEKSMVLPYVVKNLAPTVVAYISLGAVAGGVMSSADAGILSSSSQFVRNVYRTIFRPKASERELLWVLRTSMVFFGAAATVISLSVKSLYGLWILAGDLPYVLLFPQLTCLLFLERHCNAVGASVAFVVCLLVRLMFGEPVLGFPPLVKLPFYDEEQGLQLFPFKTAIMLLGFVLLIGVSKMAKLTSKRHFAVTVADNNDANPVVCENLKRRDSR